MQRDGLALGRPEPHGFRKLEAGVVLLVVGLGARTDAGIEALLPADQLAGSCTVSEVRSQAPTRQQRPEEQAPAEPTQAAGRPPRLVEALQPPRERELQDLGAVLKALASAETSGPALAALGEGKPFSLQRFAVLLGDVRSIVAHVHAQELLGRLGQSKGLAVETRQWIEQNARVIEDCGSSRFENRGGPVVYEQIVAMVGKQRSQLEPLLFESAQPQASPPPTLQSAKRKKVR